MRGFWELIKYFNGANSVLNIQREFLLAVRIIECSEEKSVV